LQRVGIARHAGCVSVRLWLLVGSDVPLGLSAPDEESLLVALLAPDESGTWPDYRVISVDHRRRLAGRLADRDSHDHAWIAAEAELWRATARLAATFPFLGLTDMRYLTSARQLRD